MLQNRFPEVLLMYPLCFLNACELQMASPRPGLAELCTSKVDLDSLFTAGSASEWPLCSVWHGIPASHLPQTPSKADKTGVAASGKPPICPAPSKGTAVPCLFNVRCTRRPARPALHSPWASEHQALETDSGQILLSKHAWLSLENVRLPTLLLLMRCGGCTRTQTRGVALATATSGFGLCCSQWTRGVAGVIYGIPEHHYCCFFPLPF